MVDMLSSVKKSVVVFGKEELKLSKSDSKDF